MSYNHYNQIYLHTTQPLGIETMNNRPFPPIILTHLTTNTARYYGVCQHGLNLFLKQKNLTNCTAISVSHLLEILENDNPSDQIYYRQWFSLLSGAQGSGYLNGNTTGDEDGDGFGAEWSSGDGYDSELTYDSSNPLGDGFGHGNRYGDAIGNQNADGTGTGWCYGVCYPCGNGTHDDHHYT